MPRLAAVQSSYVPWKGYFDLIAAVDEFVLYDDVQYTKHDWRNRNRIKTREGVRWLTIPVRTTGRFGQRINQVELVGPHWARRHLRSLRQAYAGAPAFCDLLPWLEDVYQRAEQEQRLSRINELFVRELCALLGITTRITRAADHRLPQGRVERLVELCRQRGADEYLSGPAARSYLDEEAFSTAGIGVRWMDYDGYLEYPQLWPPFEHRVSVLDLLVHVGVEAAPCYLCRTAGSGR